LQFAKWDTVSLMHIIVVRGNEVLCSGVEEQRLLCEVEGFHANCYIELYVWHEKKCKGKKK